MLQFNSTTDIMYEIHASSLTENYEIIADLHLRLGENHEHYGIFFDLFSTKQYSDQEKQILANDIVTFIEEAKIKINKADS